MAPSPDKRYVTVKRLITAGYLMSFREIFDTLPKSVMARDLGMNNNRFTYLMHHVDKFTLEEIFSMAYLVDIENTIMIGLMLSQYRLDAAVSAQ